MNTKNIKFTLVPLTLVMLAVSCATPPKGATIVDSQEELPSLQAVLVNRLSQLKIGMPLEEFRRLMPEAYVGGQNDATTAYEIAKSRKFVTQDDMDRQNFMWGIGSPRSRSKREVLWFYFYKDQLVRWGRPQDWPDKPDIILEKRIR